MPVNDNKSPNLRDNPTTSPEVIKSLREDKFKAEEEPPKYEPSSNDSYSPLLSARSMHVVEPNELVGRILILDKEGRHHLRARIVKAIDDFEGHLAQDFSRLKFF